MKFVKSNAFLKKPIGEEWTMLNRKQRNRGYAAKRASGKQMYGPGCCAHDRVITPADREHFARLRRENERDVPPRYDR